MMDRFRVLFELESDAVLVIDTESGHILEANAAASRLYGFSASEWLRLRDSDLSAEGSDMRGLSGEAPLDARPAVTIPLRFQRRKDGTVFPAEIAVRSFDEDGQARHVAAVRDLTARWQAERGLQESEERFRTTLEHAPDGVFIEVEQRFAYLNAAAVRLFGAANAAELLGTPVADRCHADHRELARERTRLLSQERRMLPPVDQVYLRLDGSLFPVEVSAAPITYMHKPGALVFAHDITRRKRLEVELAQAQKLDSIGRIAGGIAHDFNNMLNVIGGYTEMALARLRSDDPLRTQLLEVKQAGDRAAELTRQLLAFSRRQASAPKLLDLNQYLRRAEGMMKRLLGEAVSLRLELWEGAAFVRVDPAQLEQLLVNLLSNSKDALAGVGTVRIETSVMSIGVEHAALNTDCAPGPYVALSVTDNGMGMDEGTRQHLFEPFFTTKAASGSQGLGLAVVYGIVKQHLGCVDVSSAVGQGTTIRVFLPRQEVASLPGLRDTTAGSAPLSGREVVLVVEDEEQVRKLVVTALERGGYSVLQAGSPEAAIDLARETAGTIDLLLTDVIMPGMDGAELQRRLQRMRPTIRTLFMSGYASNIMGEHGILDDGVYFIQKPFSVVDLMRKVRELLA